jgi:ribonuclease P protein component
VGNAVIRKQVTRRLRHLLRDRLAELPPGALLVVRALPPAGRACAPDLATSVTQTWERALSRAGAR